VLEPEWEGVVQIAVILGARPDGGHTFLPVSLDEGPATVGVQISFSSYIWI
jgi:hypothetical protein